MSEIKAPREFLSCETTYTLGADPEFFIMANNKLIPAFEFLPPKDNGEKIDVYWDGFQAEFTMPVNSTPTCIALHGCDVHNQLSKLSQWAVKENKDARICIDNVVRIPDAMLKKALDPHVALGCMPSENVYGLKGEYIGNGRLLKYRFAGGHMHFGGWAGKKMDPLKYIKTLDKILGVWCVGAAQNIDVPVRRRYYGLAGEFRHTFYPRTVLIGSSVLLPQTKTIEECGFEYRTLSNFYYCHPGINQLVWEIGRSSLKLADSGFADVWAADEAETIQTINTCDVMHAKASLKRNEPIFRWMLKSMAWNGEMIDLALQIGLKGVERAVAKPNDIENNWQLDDGDNGTYSRFKENLSYARLSKETA